MTLSSGASTGTRVVIDGLASDFEKVGFTAFAADRLSVARKFVASITTANSES